MHHRLNHSQQRLQNVEPAPQDPVFVQGQLLRSITAALSMAGFDSVKPTALEMFRSHAEEYMLELLHYVRTAMHGSRRTRPSATDFEMALSLMPNSSSTSYLTSQVKLSIPEEISCPAMSLRGPPPTSPPDLSGLLQPLVEKRPRAYIPAHFPILPPRHAWMSTPVYSERERDPRKMREKATEEGMMAEQALRKLATAAKAGALKAERRRSSVLSGQGRARVAGKSRQHDEDTFADVMNEVGDSGGAADEVADAHEEGPDVEMPEGVVVNYDMGHWRHGAGRKALRL